jgi:outer membrane receptor for ferric coprogen and ferric-rhodotorulic acid
MRTRAEPPARVIKVDGIYVENKRNVGSYQYFSRGYQLQVQFDGVPSAVRIGDRDAISLDSAMIDRVEVLQGAAHRISRQRISGVVDLLQRRSQDRGGGRGLGCERSLGHRLDRG